jgi:hypothetical protein
VDEDETVVPIVRVDMDDTYLALAQKVRLTMGLLLSLVPDATHVMKTDDDVFLRPDELCAVVARAEAAGAGDGRQLAADHGSAHLPLYLGHMHERAFVTRHPNAPYAEPTQRDCTHHLPYASGAGYVVGVELANYLAMPPVPLRAFNNEDVAVGFWLAPLAIRRVATDRGVIRPERDPPDAPLAHLCPGPGVILQHRLTPDEMRACVRDHL